MKFDRNQMRNENENIFLLSWRCVIQMLNCLDDYIKSYVCSTNILKRESGFLYIAKTNRRETFEYLCRCY